MIAESTLSQEQQQVIDRLQSLIASGYTLPRIQVESGVRADNIKAYIQGHRPGGYRANAAEQLSSDIAKLTAFLDEQMRLPMADGYAVTPTFQAMQSHMQLAVSTRLIIAITGGVGIGKSEASKAFAAARPRTNRAAGCIRVEFLVTDNRSSAALSRIHAAVTGESYTGKLRGDSETAILAGIESALRPDDCLVLDECNYLGDAIDAIRSIHDRCKLPIVMIGNPDFGAGIFGKKSRFEAFANRTVRREFTRTTEDDVDAWLAWAGLSGSQLRRIATAIACRPGRDGGLRTLAQLVHIARTGYPNHELTADLLKSLAAETGKGV